MLIILLYRFKIKAIKLVIISSTKKKKLVIKFYLISNCVHKFIVTFIHVHSIYSESKISYSHKQFIPLNPYNLLSKICTSKCDQIIWGGKNAIQNSTNSTYTTQQFDQIGMHNCKSVKRFVNLTIQFLKTQSLQIKTFCLISIILY